MTTELTNGTTKSPEAQSLAPAHSSNSTASPYSSEHALAVGWRMAKSLAASQLVPLAYQNKPENCLIALELASRIGISVMASMQNLYVVHGMPSWSAKFLIGTVNASGRFTPLRFEWSGEPGKDSWACRAIARDKATNELLEGPWITWQMAVKEGWTTKKGSKWLTMPTLMFPNRAATFWTRLYCPEISLGFQTTEEVIDVHGEAVEARAAILPAEITPAGAKALEAVLGMQASAPQQSSGEPDAPQLSGGAREPGEEG